MWLPFGPLKEALEGEKFDDDAAVKQFVRNYETLRYFFQGKDQKVFYPWRKCISVEGNYVEKYVAFVILSVTNKLEKQKSGLYLTFVKRKWAIACLYNLLD